jgi:hypothetical protein
MRRRHFLSLFAATSLAPVAADALTLQTIEHPLRPAGAPAGALSWDLLASAGPERFAGDRLSRFPESLRALDGQDVLLAGFMFPVGEGDSHSRFLLSGFAWHCGLCSLQDTTQLVDVTSLAPVPFTPGTLALRGRLHLVEDPGLRLFYRLGEARAA